MTEAEAEAEAEAMAAAMKSRQPPDHSPGAIMEYGERPRPTPPPSVAGSSIPYQNPGPAMHS